MIRFIDMHRDQFGVELICRVLKDAVRGFLTSRGYRAAKSRPASARQLKDELLVGEIRRLHAENYGVYGVRKMHALLRRQGWDVGRDQTARLMRLAGVRGVKRSKKVFTTKPDPTIPQPKDLVKRNFTAPAPRRLWVADITYVATWAGFAYVAFVIDVFSRMIVGWNVASTLKADVLPLQALNMAAFNATGALDELVHHADHGSNYLSIVYTDRIVELGAKPSTGTVGDSFDNALAEAVNGLYKTELIRRQGPWRTIEQVELATLEYVWWWNNQRLHGELDYRPPVEVEDAYYADLESAQPVIAGQGTDRNETQGDSLTTSATTPPSQPTSWLTWPPTQMASPKHSRPPAAPWWNCEDKPRGARKHSLRRRRNWSNSKLPPNSPGPGRSSNNRCATRNKPTASHCSPSPCLRYYARSLALPKPRATR